MKREIRKVQIVVYRRVPDTEVLLLRRPPRRGSIWQPVTGKVEPDDRNLSSAARRELLEETGIGHVDELRDMEREYRFRKNDAEVCERLFAARVSEASPIRLSPEHVAFEWLPAGAALERLAWETHRDGLRRVLDEVG